MRWYKDIFGFQEFDRSQIPGTEIKVAHMLAPEFILEIFEPPNGNPLPEERKIPNQDLMTCGNKHLSFGVSDRMEAKQELEKMGVQIVLVTHDSVFICDNTGNLIEIFEEKGLWWEKAERQRKKTYLQ